MQWKNNQLVSYTSRKGTMCNKTITLTTEGFISIDDDGEEILFSKNGLPINEQVDSTTKGPSIKPIKHHKQEEKIPNYKLATFENPWDNVFALKNLLVSEWKELIEIVDKTSSHRKLHLKNFGIFATIEDKNKVLEIFKKAKLREEGKNK